MKSALSQNPNKFKRLLKSARGQTSGALAYDPSTLSALNDKQAKIQARLDAGKGNAKKLQNRLGKVGSAIGNIESSSGHQLAQTNNQANQAIGSHLQHIQDQGQFQPGDYTELRADAEQRVMDSFNRQLQPEFQRQDEQFRERMALQGVPEGSEKWNVQYEQMANAQGTARQNAMDQAFQTGSQEQQVAYGQGLTTHNNAYQNLASLNPYYSGQLNQQQAARDFQNQQTLQQGQNKYNANQAQLDRDHQWRVTTYQRPSTGGGFSGAAPVDRNAGLNTFYDNYINQFQQQPQQPSAGNTALQGIASGIGAGISNSIFG